MFEREVEIKIRKKPNPPPSLEQIYEDQDIKIKEEYDY